MTAQFATSVVLCVGLIYLVTPPHRLALDALCAWGVVIAINALISVHQGEIMGQPRPIEKPQTEAPPVWPTDPLDPMEGIPTSPSRETPPEAPPDQPMSGIEEP